MSDRQPLSLADLIATDATIDALATRQAGGDDPVVDLLAGLVAALDRRAMADVVLDTPEQRTGRSVVVKAAVLAVALTLSSTGIAAAMKGDPLLPIHLVVSGFSHLGPDINNPADADAGLAVPVHRTTVQRVLTVDRSPSLPSRPSRASARPQHTADPAPTGPSVVANPTRRSSASTRPGRHDAHHGAVPVIQVPAPVDPHRHTPQHHPAPGPVPQLPDPAPTPDPAPKPGPVPLPVPPIPVVPDVAPTGAGAS